MTTYSKTATQPYAKKWRIYASYTPPHKKIRANCGLAVNSWLYTIFRTGILRENTVNPIYSYWQPNISLGVGAEIPYGFHIYIESSFYFSQYDDERLVAKDGDLSEIKEKDFIQRYAVSLSNNKFDIWGFVPTVTVAYTRRDSNIWQQEYDKFSAAFTLQQRF